MEEQKKARGWKVLETIVFAVLGIIGLVFSGLAYYSDYGGQPDLVYSSGNATFSGEETKTYNVTFFNLGEGTAQNVQCGIYFSDAEIEKADFVTEPMSLKLFQAEEKQTLNQYGVELDYMNPGQSVTIYTRVNPVGSSFTEPKIDFYSTNTNSQTLTGKNLTESEPKYIQWWIILIWSIGVFFLGCIAPRIWRMIKYLWEKTA